MRKLLLALGLAMALVSSAFGAGAPQTKNTVPSSTSSFLTDLQTFLREEDAERDADIAYGFVVSNCSHSTGAGLTGNPGSCTAYPGGWLITETGTITYPDNDIGWVIADKNTAGNAGTFTRVAGTHYLTDFGSGAKPALPVDSAWLMEVTTLAGAISAVTDLRSMAPDITTYLHSELPSAATRGRVAWVRDQDRLFVDTGAAWVGVGTDVYGEVLNLREHVTGGSGTSGDPWTGTFQAAFDASLNIFIPAGFYSSTVTLTVRNNHVVIGAGIKNTVIINTTTTGFSRQGASTVTYVNIGGFSIRSGTPGVPAQIAFDLSGFQYGKFWNLEGEFGTICFLLARPAGVATFFNTLYSPKATSCTVGIDVDSTNSGVNANTFYDIVIDDTTAIMTTGLKVSGAAGLYSGVYVGSASTDAILFRSGQTADRNVLERVYIEGTPTDGIDADIGAANRRNTIIGIHFDGVPTNKVRDPDNQLTIIDTEGIGIGLQATATYRMRIANGSIEFTGTGGDISFTGASSAVIGHTGAFELVWQTNGATGLAMDTAQMIRYTGKTLATLGTPSDGTAAYCSDCTIANPCAAAGTGAFAKRLNGAWVCN